MMRLNRRVAVPVAALAVGALALTGCASSKSPSSAKGPTTLEIYSWWTGPGESAGLAAMIKDFKQKNPGIKVVNEAVAGGAGVNAKPQLLNRLAAHRPPDAIQAHAGAEIGLDYAKKGWIVPLDNFYTQQNLRSAYPQQLLSEITYNGHLWSVPVNIHRANIMWYNPALLKKAGVSVPITSMKTWLADMAKLKAKGITPLALDMSDTFGGEHLLENVLLSDLGPDAYSALWKKGGAWSSAGVTKALNDYNTITKNYINSNYGALTWQEAGKLVTDSKAAMFIMGDWAYGYYHGATSAGNLGLTDLKDFAWQATPGTDGVYQWLSDSFAVPVGAPHQSAAMKWLGEVASKTGQDLFNPLKGSVPARTDANPALYKSYLAWDLKQWHTDKLVGSATHNVVASDEYDTAIQNAMSDFLSSHNVSKFQSALVAANQQYGM